ncbi:MAG: GntP family permease, partial [Clostridium sp.]|nr:GntP family permease [Clostridium sp.]
IATICSGGLDSLPSNGTSIKELTQAQLPHRVGYRPLGVCSVVIPLIVALCLAVIAQFGIV